MLSIALIKILQKNQKWTVVTPAPSTASTKNNAKEPRLSLRENNNLQACTTSKLHAHNNTDLAKCIVTTLKRDKKTHKI